MKEFNVTYVSSFVKIDDYKQDKFRNLLKDAEKSKSVIRWYAQDQYTPRNGCDWYIHDKSKIFGSSKERRQEVFNVLNTDFKHRTKGQRSLNQAETVGKDSFKNYVNKVYEVNFRTELISHLKDMIVYSKLPKRHKEFNGVYQHDCALEDEIFISEIQNNNVFRVCLDKGVGFNLRYGDVKFRQQLLKEKEIKVNISLCSMDDEDNITEETVYLITLFFHKQTHKELLFWNGNIGRHYTNPANFV